MNNISKLEKLSITGGTWIANENVFHVTTQHAFVQAAGYLKYALRSDGPVFFRGQSKRYTGMIPSLLRGVNSISSARKRIHSLGRFRNEIRDAKGFISRTPDVVHDALLQHYGIRTNWIDMIDNVWIALWFACHDAVSQRHCAQHIYFQKRKRSHDEYAFVAMIQPLRVKGYRDEPGVLRGRTTTVVDLRVAAPSLYLRPHAQHGLLISSTNYDSMTDIDLERFIVGWIRVDIGDALDWLGNGDLLSVHSLFPPPHYDFGFRKFLEKVDMSRPNYLGGIHNITA